MKKLISFIFKVEVLILGFILFQRSLGEVRAVTAECWFPTCFPPCIPTCPPKPTPTEVIPTPTPEEPTPTLPSEPIPTVPPSVGGPPGEAPPEGGGPPVCGAQTPPVPHLKSVTTIKISEVELVWDPVEPVTHYSLSYGPSAGNYLYGVPNTGKVTSFRVGALGSGNYCFIVRAVNDCAPSDPSNELCTGRAAPQVLGISVLGATGEVVNLAWQTLFIIGVVCASLGVRICLSGQRKVFF